MSETIDAVAPFRGSISDCWNRIGTRGDGSCPELTQHVHCHNCPIYAAAALTLLEGEPPQGCTAGWTAHFAEPDVAAVDETQSLVIFRLGTERLALPTRAVKEVASTRKIHTLPQRRGVVMGVANVHGELLVCASLNRILGMEEPAAASQRASRSARLLVVRHEETRAVCPVDEVYGIHHCQLSERQDPPATVAKATTAYSTHVLPWRGQPVGLLDDQLVLYTIKRSLA